MTLKEWETLMKERGYIPSPTPQRTFSTYEKTHSDYRIFSCYPQTFWNIIHHSSYADCFKRANYVIEHDLKNGNRQETFKISFCYQHHKGTASSLVYRIETGKILLIFLIVWIMLHSMKCVISFFFAMLKCSVSLKTTDIIDWS